MLGALLWGWDNTNKAWIPLQVDANGYVKVDISNIKLNDLADVSTGAPADGYVVYWDNGDSLWKAQRVKGSNLGQTFGASSERLHTLLFTPKQGLAFTIAHASASPFSGKINGAPTATSVVYDNETNENCLKGIAVAANRWGRFILHNTTRSNSRLIVDFEETTNTITTESSTDDWANNDDITLQSQTCTQAGYMDVDLSDEVSSNEVVGYFQIEAVEQSGGAQFIRRVILHPYESYNVGKRVVCPHDLADEYNSVMTFMAINSQKICVFFDKLSDSIVQLSVPATMEYADT